MQKPARPFESLEWYRLARLGYDAEHPWLSRARSFATVRAHVSIFAVGAIALLVINLLGSPERVWADTAIAVWGLFVVMHAVATGILLLVAQLLAEEEDIRPASEVRWDPMRTWMAVPTAQPEPANGVTGMPTTLSPQTTQTTATPTASSDMAGTPAPATGETLPSAPADSQAGPGWREPVPPAAPPAAERASWKEASDAAWLGRRHLGGHPRARDGEEPPTEPTADAPKPEPPGKDRPTPEQST